PPEGEGSRTAVRTFAYAAERGYPADEIFNIAAEQPIELRASIRLDADDPMAKDPLWLAAPLDIGVCLQRPEDGLSITLTQLRRRDGQDLAAQVGADSDLAVEEALERLGPQRGAEPHFTLLRADRTILTDIPIADEASALATREPMPVDLGLALYDAENTT